ncbi:protein FAM219A isoform X3 [Parambassis ranga]|uniref:Protein FAM219A isoform X3 n=1 Tax=Parambassis ranga TaxID=210632 RepID=A0A6P7I0G8_9TELE|nr:protein FAM219A-like isoform X3 [Parambassis ranga]
MMEEIDRFQVPPVNGETQPLDPAASSTSEVEPDTKGESVAMNYKPSPLQVQIEKQRDLARKGSVKNGTVGSPVNQQPKKNARTRLVVPNKGYSSLDQSPDEKPLVALDTDSDDDFDMSRYSSSGYSSAEVRCLRDQMCSSSSLGVEYGLFVLSSCLIIINNTTILLLSVESCHCELQCF